MAAGEAGVVVEGIRYCSPRCADSLVSQAERLIGQAERLLERAELPRCSWCGAGEATAHYVGSQFCSSRHALLCREAVERLLLRPLVRPAVVRRRVVVTREGARRDGDLLAVVDHFNFRRGELGLVPLPATPLRRLVQLISKRQSATFDDWRLRIDNLAAAAAESAFLRARLHPFNLGGPRFWERWSRPLAQSAHGGDS